MKIIIDISAIVIFIILQNYPTIGYAVDSYDDSSNGKFNNIIVFFLLLLYFIK